MNDDIIRGRWSPLHGKLKPRWSRFADEDLRRMDGHRGYLAGTVPERYGIARDTADAQGAGFGRALR